MINATFSVMPLPSLSLSNIISLDYIPHLLAPSPFGLMMEKYLLVIVFPIIIKRL